VLVTLAVPARAQWQGTTSGLDYTDTSNWAGADVNDTFSGSYGWASGFSININDDHEVKNNFTWRVGDVQNVNLNNSGSHTWTFSSKQPVFTVDFINSAQTLNFGASGQNFSWNFQNGSALTLAVSPTTASIANPMAQDTLAIYATINNVGSLTKTGGGLAYLYRAVNVSGKVDVLGGQLLLGSNSAANYGKITGATEYNVVGRGSVLGMTITHGSDNNVLGNAPVNLYSGALHMGPTSINQSVGAVNLYGRAAISSQLNVSTTLTLTSLERHNFATFAIVGANQNNNFLGTPSNSYFVKIADEASSEAIVKALVGGDGGVGSTTQKILPWAAYSTFTGASSVANNNDGFWSGDHFVTYTHEGGFRYLLPEEFVQVNASTPFSSATTYDNVLIKAAGNTFSIGQNQTINSLKFADNSTYNITIETGNTLTISSGALAWSAWNNSNIKGDGTLSSGTNPLISTGRGSTNTISASITNAIEDEGAAGLIVANLGNGLTLNGVNTYGGMTLVQGILNIGSAGALPLTTELRVDNSGLVNINSASKVRKLSGAGTVTASGGLLVTGSDTGTPTSKNILVTNGGILAPGDISGAFQAGTLLLGANITDLEFGKDGIFAVDLSADANDLVRATVAGIGLSIGDGASTLKLTYLDGYNSVEGMSWLLTEGFSSSIGTLTNMTVSDVLHEDWEYSLMFDNNNLRLTLDSIPEPSTWLLLTVGATLLVTTMRRRRR
jgi:hypothetical protein